MIRCLAIDDEPLALKQLAAYIEKTPFLNLIKSCHSAVEARKVMSEDEIDAIFIDINMPDLNGLEFVRSLDNPPIVVFTTSYTEYAIEGYKVNAIDYLLKPFGLDDFQRAADKVKKQYDLLHNATVSQVDDDDTMFVKTDYKIMRINTLDITHIEAMSEYLRIHIDGVKRPMIVLLSMKKMEECLPANRFMRVHRSYIINLRRIKQVSKSRITLDNEAEVPIGDLYKDAFNDYLNSKFVGK